jgi:tetratricopeptide (TPR) repeat protein
MTPYIMIRYDEATRSWVVSLAPDEDGPLQWQVIARYATEEEAASHARELRRQYDGDTEDAPTPPPKSPLQPMRANAGAPAPPGYAPDELCGISYILPDGRVVALEDTEACEAFVRAVESEPEKVKSLLWSLLRECDHAGAYRAGAAYAEKILALEEDPHLRANLLLNIGRLFEHANDFQAAVATYSRAFELPAERDETWYFLNNNLGYSLNQVGRHAEAEAYCRAAIAIDPDRHNAHKNLGLSLQGQGRYLEAAQCLLEAARINPRDRRALGHLEDLLAQHQEVGRDHPEFLEAAQQCRDAVRILTAERIM